MNKHDFIAKLRAKLSGLPDSDVRERLGFYSEMIDDRIEEGLSEEAAVSEIGSVDDIAAQIVVDIPLIKIVKEKIKPKRQPGAVEIILLALGSPLWLSLLIAAFAVVLSLYAVLWSVIISVWAVFTSLIACAFAGISVGIFFVCLGNGPGGIAISGAGSVCAGLSVFLFYGSMAATKATLLLTKKISLSIKNCFIKKEEI